MRLGIRGKLFAISVGLMLPAVATSAVYLEFMLRESIESRVEQTLIHYAGAAETLLLVQDTEMVPPLVDPLIDRLGAATEARITLIDPSGRVIADSDVTLEGLSEVENHADRPEVQAVVAGEPYGVGRRRSSTVGHDMLYVAVPLANGNGIIRASLPLREVDVAIRRFRIIFGLAALLGVFVAILMSGLASHLISRTMEQLVEQAKAMAERTGMPRAPEASDEIGSIAGSMSQMAEELERVVATLAAERDRFGAVLEGMGEAVIAIGPDRVVRHVNPAALEMLHIEREPLDRALTDIVRVPQIHNLVDRALAADAAAAPLSEEMTFVGPPARTVRVNASPVRVTGGLVLVLHDITELRRLENLRREFVANVSHELRTPVSVIRATAETLADGALEAGPDVAGGFVDAILRNSERLTRLISDLLDISRIDSGNYRTEITEVEVHEAIARATQSVKDGHDEHRISVLCDPSVVVLADAFALEHVLINLLENAVKYTPSGSHVQVRVRESAERVVVEVADDGPGIEARHRPRVFERFYRVDAGRSREKGGTGLGLSIVKNLVQSMQGTVGVKPNEPRGSVFWFELPAATVEHEEVA
jgi:two-component system, OmpR family, phosphate regulon sensor histidine kinase PhoR